MVKRSSPWRHAQIITGEKPKRDLSAIKEAITPYLAEPIYDVELSIHIGILTCEIKMALLEMEQEGTARRAPYGYWVFNPVWIDADIEDVKEYDRFIEEYREGEIFIANPNGNIIGCSVVFNGQAYHLSTDEFGRDLEWHINQAKAFINEKIERQHQEAGQLVLWEVNQEEPWKDLDYSTSAQELGQGFQQPQLNSENLTSESPQLVYEESSTSTRCYRRKGQGSGALLWRTTNKTRKNPTEQLYFEWELGEVRGCTYVRSHLKELIVRLNEQKRPVQEILKHLAYNPKVKSVLSQM